MQVTNLGDCGFRVIREGSCIFASDVSPLLALQSYSKPCFTLMLTHSKAVDLG